LELEEFVEKLLILVQIIQVVEEETLYLIL